MSVEKGGTSADKYTFITEYVLQKFEEAYDRRLIVHDIHLREWALKAKNQVHLLEFKISGGFRNSRICTESCIDSRKITTFKTQRMFKDIGNL